METAKDLLNKALGFVLEAELVLLHGCNAGTPYEIERELGKEIRYCVENCEKAEEYLCSAVRYLEGE